MNEIQNLEYQLRQSLGKYDRWLNRLADHYGDCPSLHQQLQIGRDVLEEPRMGLAQAQFERLCRRRRETGILVENIEISYVPTGH